MDNGSTAYVRLSNINRTDFDMYTYTKCNAYNCIAVFWLGFPYLPDVNTRKMFKKYCCGIYYNSNYSTFLLSNSKILFMWENSEDLVGLPPCFL